MSSTQLTKNFHAQYFISGLTIEPSDSTCMNPHKICHGVSGRSRWPLITEKTFLGHQNFETYHFIGNFVAYLFSHCKKVVFFTVDE